MTTFDRFVMFADMLQEQARKDERVCKQVQGIEAHAINYYKSERDGDTIVVHGFDANGVETVLVMPASHFSVSLTVVPKQKHKRVLGFKTSDVSDAQSVKS